MRLSLWTPQREGWLRDVVTELARSVELALPSDADSAAAPADLAIYHVADQPAHGFVYRALLREPGLVILEDWQLHRLVFAETAGRGDVAGYLREARRAHGPLGSFVASQVLGGTAGLLPTLVALNERVLEAAVGLAATSEVVGKRARARLGERPVRELLPEACPPAEAASAILELARELLPRLPEARRMLADERALEATPLGRAFAELRPFARELGLRNLPAEVFPRVAELIPRG